MEAVVTGGCLCGNIRYEYLGEVGPASYCHCADCRRCTGSAFNVGVRVDARLFRLVQGAPKAFEKAGESGSRLSRHFCPDCGSPLFTSSPRHPEALYVKAGSLDDPAMVAPAYQSWLDSKVVWAAIPPDLPGHAKGRR